MSVQRTWPITHDLAVQDGPPAGQLNPHNTQLAVQGLMSVAISRPETHISTTDPTSRYRCRSAQPLHKAHDLETEARDGLLSARNCRGQLTFQPSGCASLQVSSDRPPPADHAPGVSSSGSQATHLLRLATIESTI